MHMWLAVRVLRLGVAHPLTHNDGTLCTRIGVSHGFTVALELPIVWAKHLRESRLTIDSFLRRVVDAHVLLNQKQGGRLQEEMTFTIPQRYTPCRKQK